MDEKELSSLIDQLVAKGATDEEIDVIVKDYQSKKPSPQQKVAGAFQASIEGKKAAGKMPVRIDKRLQPDLDEWLANEKNSAKEIAQKELDLWAKSQAKYYKGMEPETAEAAFKKTWDKKASEVMDRINKDMAAKYGQKIVDLEKASMALQPANVSSPQVPKDAPWYMSLGKKALDVFSNQLPKSFALNRATNGPSSYYELQEEQPVFGANTGNQQNPYYTLKESLPKMSDFVDIESAAKKFSTVTLRNGDKFDVAAALNDIKNKPELRSAEARADYFDTKYLRKALGKDKLNAFAEAQKQNKESAELLADVPSSWDEMKFGDNFLSYASGAIGQGLGSSALALGTMGAGSFELEKAGVLEEGINAKAAYLSKLSGQKITPEDVIESGDYDDVVALANTAGAINAALEYAGSYLGLGKLAKGILGKKLTGSLLRTGVTGMAGEASTETGQELVSLISAKMAGGQNLTQAAASIDDKDLDRIFESARQGGMAGLVFGGTGGGISSVRQGVDNIAAQMTVEGLPSSGDQTLDAAQVKMFTDITAAPTVEEANRQLENPVPTYLDVNDITSRVNNRSIFTTIKPEKGDVFRGVERGALIPDRVFFVSENPMVASDYTRAPMGMGKFGATNARYDKDAKFQRYKVSETAKILDTKSFEGFNKLLALLGRPEISESDYKYKFWDKAYNFLDNISKENAQKIKDAGYDAIRLYESSRDSGFDRVDGDSLAIINPEILKENPLKNAVQEQETSPVPVQPETGNGQEVAQGTPTPESQAPAPTQGEVVPPTEPPPPVEQKPFSKFQQAPSPKGKPGRLELTMGNSKLYITQTDKGIVLDRIETEEGKKKKGSLKRAIKAFLKETDRLGLKVTTQVSPDKGTDRKRLTEFIRSLGFEGDDIFMQREVGAKVPTPQQKRIEDEKRVQEVEDADETEFTEKARNVIADGVAEGTINETQERELQALLNNASGKNSTASSRKKFFSTLRSSMGVPVEVVTNDVKLRLESIKDQIRGIKFGSKMARDSFREAVQPKLKEMLKYLRIPERKAKAIMRRIAGVNFNSDTQLKRLSEYLTDMSMKIEAENVFAHAVELRKKLRKNIEGFPVGINNPIREKIKTIAKLDIRDVDPYEYTSVVEPLMNYLKHPTSPEYAAAYFADATAYADREATAMSNRLREELTAMGVDTAGLNDAQVMSLTEYLGENDPNAEAATEAAATAKRDKLMEAYEYSRMGFEEAGLSGPEYEALLSLDPERLPSHEVVRLIKAMDNAAVNGDFSGIGNLLEAARAQKEIAKSKGTKLSGVDVGETQWFFNTSQVNSVKELYRLIFGQLETASKLLASSGVTRYIDARIKVSRYGAKFTKELENFRQNANKHIKFGNEALTRTNLFSLLVGHDPAHDPQKTFERMKDNINTSIERKRKAGMHGEADQEQKFMDTVVNDREAFIKDFKARHPWEYKLWELVVNKFKQTAPEYQKVVNQYFDKVWRAQENYVPHTQMRVTGLPIDAKRGRAKYSKITAPKLAGSAHDRTYTLGQDKVYSSNFLMDVINQYEQQLTQIEVVPAKTYVKTFFNDPQSQQLFGGAKPHQVVVDTFNAMDGNFENLGVTNDNPLLSKASEAMSGLGRSVLFSGPARYLYQYVAPMVNLITQLGKSADLAFVSVPNDFKLANESTLGVRSATQGGLNTNDADFNYHLSKINIDAGATEKVFEKMQRAAEWLAWGHIKGDLNGAYRAFAAFYLKSLREQGVDVSNIDWDEEYKNYKNDPKRTEAFNYAQDAVDVYLGASAGKTSPAILHPKSLGGRVAKNALFSLTSFSVMQKKRMANDVRIMYAGDMEMKKEAAKDLVASMAENATYNAVRTFLVGVLLNQGAYALMDAMGWEYPDRDEDKEKKKRYTNWLSSTLYDMIPGIFMVTELARNGFLKAYNEFAYKVALEEDPDMTYQDFVKEGGATFVNSKGDPSDMLGLYGVWMGTTYDTYRDAKNIYMSEDGEITIVNPDGSERVLELSEDQKDALEFVVFTESMAALGLSWSELTKIGQKIKQETIKQIKEDEK